MAPYKPYYSQYPVFSLQRLSVDFSKSSEALQSWAKSEGDDLEVCLSTVPLQYIIINRGIPGYLLRMLGPTRPLD